MKMQIVDFSGLTESFGYCRPPDTASKIKSPWDSNYLFKSYLSNRSQYVSMNQFESGLAVINCGVLQEYAL